MDGTVHHFGAIGIVNGLAVLADRETRTYWDHITGEAFDGPLAGRRMESWPVRMTTLTAARLEHPGLLVHVSSYHSLQKRLAAALYPHFIHGRVWLPYPFHFSMSRPVDPRLDRLVQGLGVIVGRQARYYPLSCIPGAGLDDPWNGRLLRIRRGAIDGVPSAEWVDGGEQPMQLLARWYGFSFTFPDCEVRCPGGGS